MAGAPGWFSDEALGKRASAVADLEARAWGNLGEVMRAVLNVRPGNADAASGQRGSTQPAPGPASTIAGAG